MSDALSLLILTDQPALRLRTLRDDDAPELFALVDRNRTHLREWLPWLDANTLPAHSLAFIQWMSRQFADGNGFVVGLFLKGKLVGMTGPHHLDFPNRCCQIGYWLDRDHNGRGLMTSAVRALIAHIFTELKFNRVEIRAATGNDPSQAVCARLGLIREGTLRAAEWLYDHHVDLNVYSILRREWDAIQADETTPLHNAHATLNAPNANILGDVSGIDGGASDNDANNRSGPRRSR